MENNIIEFFNNKDFSHYRNVQLSLTEITKILNFFKSYNIDYNKDVKWSIETIEAINKSIKNYVKHNITSSNYKTKHTIKINIKPAIEKISYFYNTYKQYQGHFVDIKNIDYMKKFMEEYPMYNHSIISVDNMIAMEEEMQNLNHNKQKSSALRDLYEIKNLIDYYKKTNENVSSTWRYTISNYLRISSKNLTTEILEMENLVNNIKNCNSMDDLITIAQRNNISDIKPLDNLKEQKEHLIRGTVKQLGKHKQLLDILNRIDIDFDKKRNLTLSTISDFLDNYKTTGNLFKTTDIRLPILKEFITNDKYSYYKNNNLSNDEILEIVGFFNAIPINEKRHEWNLSTIRKINKSIKKSTMVYENNTLVYKNIEEKREKLSNFYNTYKQYRGQFVDVNYVDYMDNFMKKNPSLKYSLVTATEMSIIDKLPLSSRKKAINNLVSEKSSIRLQRLRAKIRRLINKLSIKDLANKVFKRKNPVLKQEKNQKIQQIKSQTINKEL